MKVELHSHSIYSHGKKVYVEGLDSPEQMVRYASENGLGGLAITDHDVFKGSLKAKKYAKKYDVIVIPGIEITTEKRGHVLGLGIQEKIPSFLSVKETVDRIHDQGGIAVAPHPFDIGRFGVKSEVKYCDAFEIFNALSLEKASNRRSLKFYEKNKDFPVVSGTDAHCKEMLGFGAIEVKGESMDEILNNVKKGKAKPNFDYVPERIITKWAVERLRRSYTYTLKYMEENYNYPKRILYKKLLDIAQRDSLATRFLFTAMSEFCLGIAKAYGAFVELFRWRL